MPSPTLTTMTAEFLNASNAVVGSPTVLNLRTNTLLEDLGTWKTHTLTTPAAPTGSTQLRLSFMALNMVDNDGDASEGGVPRDQVFNVDYFTLKDSAFPTVDRLSGDGSSPNGNGNLNTPGSPSGWELTESPSGTDTASVINFAHHPGVTPTGQGLWLRSFQGGEIPVDSVLTQKIDAVPGGNYSFSAWSRWEGGYSGGVTTLDATSPSGAIESPTETTLEMAFLDGLGVEDCPTLGPGSADPANEPQYLRKSTLNGTARRAVSVQVTAGARQMLANIDAGGTLGNQSAFFDEFSLIGPARLRRISTPTAKWTDSTSSRGRKAMESPSMQPKPKGTPLATAPSIAPI